MNKIIHLPEFTSKALSRWNEIPKEIRTVLLDNAWCGKCSGTVSMILEHAKLKTDLLLLEGKCKICGSNVVRVVEPE